MTCLNSGFIRFVDLTDPLQYSVDLLSDRLNIQFLQVAVRRPGEELRPAQTKIFGATRGPLKGIVRE